MLSYAEDQKNNEFKNFAGIKASNISGYGIYYSRNISENYRLQGMGLVYYYQYEKEDEKQTVFNYDIGLELQRTLHRSDNFLAYILFGSYYYYDDDTQTDLVETETVNDSFNIGIGLGFEFEYKRMVFNLDVGYKYFADDIDTFTDGDFSYNEIKRVTKIGAGVGIGFMF